MGHSFRRDDGHNLPDDDCYVHCTGRHADSGGILAEIYDTCQPLCHVILILLDSDDFRGSLGLLELLDK